MHIEGGSLCLHLPALLSPLHVPSGASIMKCAGCYIIHASHLLSSHAPVLSRTAQA
eukprot:SAG31_NODE_46572_length_254_cov_0.522581_1_plen_55_part_01